ncbi:MAG: MFS transporter, partial [Anaeromyxobacteraceae bacterium]
MANDPYAALRFPEYRAFLGGMVAVFVATQIQSAVLGWQIYELTGDPLSLGLVGLAEAVPFLSLTLVGGWAADRRDSRLLSIAGLAAVGASGAWLLAVSLGSPRSTLPLYAAQALAGLGRAFFRPATSALGAEIVPRAHYHNAASWRSSFFHASMVVGPAVGGLLIALGGPRLAYAVV